MCKTTIIASYILIPKTRWKQVLRIIFWAGEIVLAQSSLEGWYSWILWMYIFFKFHMRFLLIKVWGINRSDQLLSLNYMRMMMPKSTAKENNCHLASNKLRLKKLLFKNSYLCRLYQKIKSCAPCTGSATFAAIPRDVFPFDVAHEQVSKTRTSWISLLSFNRTASQLSGWDQMLHNTKGLEFVWIFICKLLGQLYKECSFLKLCVWVG